MLHMTKAGEVATILLLRILPASSYLFWLQRLCMVIRGLDKVSGAVSRPCLEATLVSTKLVMLKSPYMRSFLVFFTSLFYVCYIHGLAALPKDGNFLYSCVVLISLVAGHKYTQ